MSVFSRLSDIINSNVNSMLDKAENPEKISRLIIQEMEDTLVEVRSTTAKSIASRKERQRQLRQATDAVDEWTAKAELALDKDREDLARAALHEKNRAAARVDALQQELAAIEEQLDRFNTDIGKLEAKIVDARKRQHELSIRHQTAQTQLKTQAQIHDHRIDDVLLRFDAVEQKIEQAESHVEAMGFGRREGLHDQINALHHSEQVDTELAEMKARVKQAAGGQ